MNVDSLGISEVRLVKSRLCLVGVLLHNFSETTIIYKPVPEVGTDYGNL